MATPLRYFVVDRVENGIPVIVWDDGAQADAPWLRGAREGWAYKVSGRIVRRDTRLEKALRDRARAAARGLRQGPTGNIQL